MTAALAGALLLLFGSLKVFLWINERLVSRQMAYEGSRVTAALAGAPVAQQPVRWQEPAERLNLFNEQRP